MAKHARRREPRPLTFYLLAAFFGLFVLFLYGPLAAIVILSFQGPNGGLTFPMNGVSTHWFDNLFQQQAVGDFGGAFTRSLSAGLIVMVRDGGVRGIGRAGVPAALLRARTCSSTWPSPA